MLHSKTDTTEHPDEHQGEHKPKSKRKLYIIVGVALALLLVPLLYAGYVYASSPQVVRDPKLEHYHFRMQILVNGKAENFAQSKYQQDYAKDQCNANLPEQPIHFHDGKDQFTHVHWEGMTGGMVMKYYGWNYIGGIDKALGYKLNDLGDVQKVNTHGNMLPAMPDGASFYVYTGDETGYKARSFDEWKNQDLENFFNKASNFPAHAQNKRNGLIDKVFPKVSAHGTEDHSSTPAVTTPETADQKLTRINNLIGNAVIFVQKEKPTDQQIKERFNDLEPLSDSTCGG